MNWIQSIVEEKIREAMQNGEFDNLPGSGKPLQLDDDSMVPEDLRVSYRIMKNAGVIPEEMQLRKDILRLEDLLSCCNEESERVKLQSEMSAKKLRYQQLMNSRGLGGSTTFTDYEQKIYRKLMNR